MENWDLIDIKLLCGQIKELCLRRLQMSTLSIITYNSDARTLPVTDLRFLEVQCIIFPSSAD